MNGGDGGQACGQRLAVGPMKVHQIGSGQLQGKGPAKSNCRTRANGQCSTRGASRVTSWPISAKPLANAHTTRCVPPYLSAGKRAFTASAICMLRRCKHNYHKPNSCYDLCKVKVVDHLKNATQTLFTFEILPPMKGASVQAIYDAIEPLMEFKPPFINVTYHREEYVFRERQGGLLEKMSIRKRPGTVGICAAIINKYKVDTVPHIICGGFSKEETENALIDLNFLGIDNVLLLRGDAIKTETYFTPHPHGHAHASDLIEQVVHMNRGIYLDEDIESPIPTQFCIGVAGYPEKHFEAANLESDLLNLKRKVDMGADYIVTQMFFENSKFFAFVNSCREVGITVPIIPGIKPMATKSQLLNLPKFFHIDLPSDLVREVEKCADNKAVVEAGIEWSIQQCRELMEYGVPSLHFYTMSKSAAVKRIAEKLF